MPTGPDGGGFEGGGPSAFVVPTDDPMQQVRDERILTPSYLTPVDSYAAAVLALGPSLYWRLDEAPVAGVTKLNTAYDLSHNGHEGIYRGVILGATGALPSGDPGVALNFIGGLNIYVEAASYQPFVPGSSRTFVGIAHRDAVNDFDILFGGRTTGGAHPVLELDSSPNEGIVRWYSSVTTFPFQSLDWVNAWPQPGTYVWYAFTVIDGNPPTCELFISGESKGPGEALHLGQPTGYDADPGVLQLGTRGPSFAGTTESFNGSMDEFAVFERILTPTEIQGLFAAAAIPLQATRSYTAATPASITAPKLVTPTPDLLVAGSAIALVKQPSLVRSVASAASVALLRAVSATKAVTVGSAVTSAWAPRRTFAVTAGSSIARLIQAGIVRSVSAGSAVSASRTVSIVRAVSTAAAATLRRAVSQIRLASAGSQASSARSASLIRLVSAGSSATSSRVVAIVRTATGGASVTKTILPSLRRSVTAGSVVTSIQGRAFLRTFAVTAGSAVVSSRLIGKATVVSSAGGVAVRKVVALPRAVTAGSVASAAKAFPRTFAVVAGSAVSVARTSGLVRIAPAGSAIYKSALIGVEHAVSTIASVVRSILGGAQGTGPGYRRPREEGTHPGDQSGRRGPEGSGSRGDGSPGYRSPSNP